MHKLVLVKHSVPEIDPALPARQWRLSGEGRHRCTALAEKLRAYAPDLAIASTEPKAMATAEIVAASLGIEWTTVEDLHEHNRSKVPFLGDDEFQMAVAELFGKPNQLIFGHETAEQARRRFAARVHQVVEQNHGRNIVLVAHGTVISLFAASVAGLDAYDLWKHLALPSFVVMTLPELQLIEVVERVEI